MKEFKTVSEPQEFLPAGERISIFLRGHTWYCNYQNNGRQIRRSLGTKSKKEAILRAQRIEADLNRGAVPDQIRIAAIGEVCDAFLRSAEVEGRATKTLTKYRHPDKVSTRCGSDQSPGGEGKDLKRFKTECGFR